MATQTPNDQAQAEVDAIARTLYKNIRESIPSIQNIASGLGIYVVNSSTPIERPGYAVIGEPLAAVLGKGSRISDHTEARRAATQGLPSPPPLSITEALTVQEGSPNLKAFIEYLGIMTLIKAGRATRNSQGGFEDCKNFMSGASGDLIGSYDQARCLIPALVAEFYEGLIRSVDSTPHSMVSVVTNRPAATYAAKKLMKAWIKEFWHVVLTRRDGTIGFGVGKEVLWLKIFDMDEDSDAEEVQEGALQDMIAAAEARPENRRTFRCL